MAAELADTGALADAQRNFARRTVILHVGLPENQFRWQARPRLDNRHVSIAMGVGKGLLRCTQIALKRHRFAMNF
jgi:hypothetical protein